MKKLIKGDCLEELKKLESNSIDGCVTDPPAGISFMNKEWDKDKGGRDEWMSWMTEVFSEVLRVLKPGGHGLVWSIPRTSHWTAMSLENAGFEIRDCVYHIQGQGFPKSHNVGMGIDKKMKLIKHQSYAFNHAGKEGSQVFDKKRNYELQASNGYFYEGKSEEAKLYDGYGSQLKPAVECWWLIRKPFRGSIVDNVLKYGTGGINIDKSRIPTTDKMNGRPGAISNYANKDGRTKVAVDHATYTQSPNGRFPANLIHDGSDEVMTEFEKYGNTKSKATGYNYEKAGQENPVNYTNNIKSGVHFDDEGSVARYFYCTKTSTAERNTGLGNLILDSMEIIMYASEKEIWKEKITTKEATKVPLLMDMELSVQKAIVEYGIQLSTDLDSSIISYGKLILERYLTDIRYTTKMKISSTTVQQTLSLLHHYTINEYTLDVFSKMMDGGNLVVNVENSNTLIITINENLASVLGVNPVALKMLIRINERKETSTHPTVKSVKLMSYLINLIMPPTGIVLDPFMGSGTTGIAALLNNYDFVGIEKQEEYMTIAENRINKYEEFRKFLK